MNSEWRVTKYDTSGNPVWEKMGESRLQSPYHQVTIEVETYRGVKRIPVEGIRRSSRLLRSEANDKPKLFADWENPVWDGNKETSKKLPPLKNLNTECDE